MIFASYVVQGTTTPITICPLGDIQWNGDREELAFNELIDHLRWCLEHPNPLFIGMGDYVDFASPSNRAALATTHLFAGPRALIGDAAAGLVEDVYELILEPTKGKWAGLLAGHHYYPLLMGGTTDTVLAHKLGAPYLGDGIAVIRIEFRDKTHTQPIYLWASHGKGGGRSASRPTDMLQQLAAGWDSIDVFLMGHHTKKCAAEKDRMIPMFPPRGEPRLYHRPVHLAGTGGWAKGILEGQTTYVEGGLYEPVVLGAPLIHIRPRWRHNIWEPRITVEV